MLAAKNVKVIAKCNNCERMANHMNMALKNSSNDAINGSVVTETMWKSRGIVEQLNLKSYFFTRKLKIQSTCVGNLFSDRQSYFKFALLYVIRKNCVHASYFGVL